KTKAFTLPLYISTILYFISYFLIILSFYFFNKIIDQFKKQNIFHLSVIKYFKTIGYLLCISFVIKFIIISIVKYKDNVFVKETVAGVNSIFEMPIVILIFGLLDRKSVV